MSPILGLTAIGIGGLMIAISELAAAVRDLAKDCGHGSALDLFSGVGLFSLPLARQFEKVVAVENSPASGGSTFFPRHSTLRPLCD
jgi:hypothetical protein